MSYKPDKLAKKISENVVSSYCVLDDVTRQKAIDEVAYLLAKSRGFVLGYELQDRLEAEHIVDLEIL